jgi:hypothetical protein
MIIITIHCRKGRFQFDHSFILVSQSLSEKMYQLVEQLEPKLTRKVTQILLELDETEVFHLMDLREKVSQVMESLRRSNAEDTCDDANLTCTLSSSSSSSHAADIASASSSFSA